MALAPGVPALTTCRLDILRLDAGRLNALLAPPTTPRNPIPPNAFVGGPQELRWEADAAQYYDVYLGTSPSALLLVSTDQVSPVYDLPALMPGTTYYWKVVAKNAYGPYHGPVWSFTASSPLIAPNTPNPVDYYAGLSPNLPTLSWSGSSEPGVTYRVYFGQAGTTLPVVAGGLTETSWTAPQLGNATAYDWRVEAVNNAGATSGTVWHFTTGALGLPTSPSPADGATQVPTTTPLAWAAAANATAYDVFFGEPGALLEVASGITSTSWTPPAALRFGRAYQWRVRARNAAGTVEGPTWGFTTLQIGVATNPTPYVGQGSVGNTPTFGWTPGAFAQTFDLYLSVGGSSYQQVAQGLTVSAWTPPTPLKNGTQYLWYVRSWNGLDYVDAPVWWFSTWQLLAPANPSPPNGAITVPLTQVLSWSPVLNATGYNVYFGTSVPPPLVSSNQPGTTYDPPGLLDPIRNYAWRIEAVNAGGTALGPLWAFTPRTPFVPTFPTLVLLEANLGPGFRSRLITEANTVAVYPLSDTSQAQARDISGHGRHGAYVGYGFEPGISFDVPEGALGTRFSGLGYVEVPDSGEGPFNLSLAGGDIDLVVLIREYVADATQRALLSKYDASNGYLLAVNNGVLQFHLRVDGTSVFNLFGGVLDSGEHVIVATYRSTHHEATIAIDGVIVATATGLSGVEPKYSTAPLRLGAFNGAAPGDGSGLRAVLAYASLGREGDAALAASLQGTRAWTDLTPHLRTGPSGLETRVGIPGSRPEDTVATTGTLNFTLDNGPRHGVEGYYTPSHAQCRPGWLIGVPIRLSLGYLGTVLREFHGRLASVTPLPGLHGAQYADCVATDWMDVAASSPLSALATQLGRRSDDVVRAVLGQAQGRSPVALELHAGASVFPYAVDLSESEHETLLTELGRVLASERGFLYIRGDMARGGRLVFESRTERAGEANPAFVVENTMQGVEVSYGLAGLVNIVRIEYTPRKVDSATTVLYTLDNSKSPQPIASGESLVLEGGYVDPTQEAARVGGTQLVPLVPGVDYGFRQNADGSGSNYTSNLSVQQTLGGSRFRVEFVNNGPPGHLWVAPGVAMQIRGLGIYHYQPVTVERRDNDSVRLRGPRPLQLTLPYETSAPAAQQIAEQYLQLYGTERPIPSSVTLNANARADFMYHALVLQPGDKLGVREPLTGIGDPRGYYIHEKRLTLAAGGILHVTFGLAPAPSPLVVGLRRQPSASV